MLKISLLSLLLLSSILFQGCSKEKKEQKAVQKANALLSTNEIVLTSLDKKQYILQKTQEGFILKKPQSKILILDLFATWCPPCQAEAPHLASLQKKYKDSITIIGVTIEDFISDEKLQTFKKEHKADYTLVNSSQNRRLIDALAKKLHLSNNFGIPLVAIFKDGKLVQYYQGATEEEFIESDIKRALGI